MISVLIPSNLSERLDSLRSALRFLYDNGFTGEIIVGVWGGYDHIGAVMREFRGVRFIRQDGADLFTTRALELAWATTGDHLIQIGDDDYLVPDALTKMAALLTDPTVFSCQGRTLQIFTGGDMRLMMFPQWPADEADTLTRYANYLQHTGQMFHAMMRRSDFIAKLRYMDAAMRATNNHVWFEIIGEFYTLIKGRFCIIEDVFILRGKHAKNTSRELLRDEHMSMFPFHLLSDEFTTHYKFFEAQVMELFASVGVDPVANRIPILSGILHCIGSVIYGLRGPPSREEQYLRQRVGSCDPAILALVDMVARARR